MNTKPLVFAIDFDGVLTNDRRFITSKLIEYFGVDRLKNVHAKMSIDYMDIDREEDYKFWAYIREDFERLPIEPEAVKAINRIRELGHIPYCVTARGNFFNKTHIDYMRESTKRRIDNAGINFKEIIFTTDKKDALFERIHHDVLIDDSIHNFSDNPVMRCADDDDWDVSPKPVEICFGLDTANYGWTGHRIINFYELDSIYKGIFTARV